MALLLAGCIFALAAQSRAPARRVTWSDVAPLRSRLEAAGVSAAAFPSYVARVHDENLRRVREGDLDHLIFYALQSTRFTSLPPIEPALSAKSLVDGLDARGRAEFLQQATVPASKIPADARARLTALVKAIDSSNSDPRLEYFRRLVKATVTARRQREPVLQREYLRAMKFLYEKEFVAQTSERRADAVADLYRSRGLSTDTAVEAGYLVYLGLGVLKSLEPDRRVRRVLIVGPGLDLAPRTGLLEAGPPESYQPWAVIDALLSLGLARTDDLEVVGADINPRVVEHLRQASTNPPSLTLVSEIRATDSVILSAEYRDYFAGLGTAVGNLDPGPILTAREGHLRKTVRVTAAAARTLRSSPLDIVTERLDGPPFDIVIATNILPYFDDTQLMLALTNIASMLALGGTFLHNEPRPLLGEIAQALGLQFEQSRHAIIATVRGAPAPLGDSIFLHRRAR